MIPSTTISKKKSWDSWWRDIIRHNGVLSTNRFERHVTLDGKSILDVGCGHLLNKFYLGTKMGYFAGVDISGRALKRANAAFPNVNVLQAEATKLPFKNRLFDVVVCTETLHYLGSDFEGAVREIARVSDESIILTIAHLEKLRHTKGNERTFAGWKIFGQGYVGVDEKIMGEFLGKIGYSITHTEIRSSKGASRTCIKDNKVSREETSWGKELKSELYLEAVRKE